MFQRKDIRFATHVLSRNDEAKILVHRPHPSDIMKEYSIKQILGQLKEHGDI